MADGFAAPRYGLMSYCGPSPFSPSRNSDARSVMLRIPLPEYADGTLYSMQEYVL